MKRYFNTLLDMFNRVISFTADPQNIAITNSIPALQQGATVTLVNKVNAINALIFPQSQNITGAAIQKRVFKKSATNLTMIVISGTKAFCKATGDENLFKSIDFSATEVYDFKDNEFASKVNGFMTLLTPFQSQLLNYGVQVSNFNDVATAVNLYITWLTTPRSKIEYKETVNKSLKILFKDTNNFVRDILDPIVVTLNISQQQYYFGYRAARKHVPHGLRHNRINATVVNELNQPYVGIQVTVDAYTDPDTGKTYDAVTGNTDINGFATVEKFWPGNRTVTISGPGITTTTFGPYNFKEGNGITETYVCQPDFNNIPASKSEEEKETTQE